VGRVFGVREVNSLQAFRVPPEVSSDTLRVCNLFLLLGVQRAKKDNNTCFRVKHYE